MIEPICKQSDSKLVPQSVKMVKILPFERAFHYNLLIMFDSCHQTRL